MVVVGYAVVTTPSHRAARRGAGVEGAHRKAVGATPDGVVAAHPSTRRRATKDAVTRKNAPDAIACVCVRDSGAAACVFRSDGVVRAGARDVRVRNGLGHPALRMKQSSHDPIWHRWGGGGKGALISLSI